MSVIRLKCQQYVHLHDNNSNITSLLTGPATRTLATHETLLSKSPEPFVVLAHNEYAIIDNPIVRGQGGVPLTDRHGQVRNANGDREIRFAQDPFPLYPNESLVARMTLQVLASNEALMLKALRRFEDGRCGKWRDAGDEYLFVGPDTYIPRVEETVVESRKAVVLKYGESLLLRARNAFIDAKGVTHQVGEEYLVEGPGPYILGVDEMMLKIITATILTPHKAIHVEVNKAFLDSRPWANKERLPGEVYRVTYRDTDTFTPQPTERIIREVPLTTLTNKQWAVILDPVGPDAKPRLGRRQVVTNQQFFLYPGEHLEGGVQNVYVLANDEAVLLVALEEFKDTDVNPAVTRSSGEQWLLMGPREYIPCSSVRVEEKRRRLVLSDWEGVYVRDTLSGEVRAVTGKAYMLQAYEELWEKQLPPVVELKLMQQLEAHSAYIDATTRNASRVRSNVVAYHVPHNSVTQVYDYKRRTQRTVFGPECVMLGPEEEFTVLSLSGSEWDPKRPTVCLPKVPDRIKSLYLFLGPSSLSDVVNVETRDHARLSLQLSYDWHFDVEPGNTLQADQCFTLPDFVGDCCSCIASRIRSSIASMSFEHFHKHSSTLVRAAVFGLDSTQQPKKELRFTANRLVVTSVDIQEIEVVDKKTSEALRQSVKMAIEITTQAQEAVARQVASVREQQARGRLDRQQIVDKSSAEAVRKDLLDLQSKSNAISGTGQAKAEARARAEAAEIEGDSKVQVTRVSTKSGALFEQARLDVQRRRAELKIAHQEARNAIEIERTKALSDIEGGKLGRIMQAVGKDTLAALARAGPELQARLLKALGLEGYLVTDGTNPINLFSTASGLAAAAQGSGTP